MPDQPDQEPDGDLGELLVTIRLLSGRAAAHLQAMSHEHAKLVVQELGLMIKFWEAAGVTLDPIQREVVLDSLVYGLSSVALGFERAVADLVEALRQQHHGVTAAFGDELPPYQG